MEFKTIEDTIIKTQGILKEFDNIQGVFGGYVAVYGNKDKQGDIIEKNAFNEDIEKFYNNEKTVAVYHEHDPYIMLATKPLELKSDGYGVYGVFKVDEKAKEIHKSIWGKLPQYYEAGILSFSIGIQKATTSPLEGGRYIIHKGIMKEFSTTITPANPKAKANIMKSENQTLNIIKSIKSVHGAEEFLRKMYKEEDFSKSEIMAFLDKIQEIGIQKKFGFAGSESGVAGHQNNDFRSEINKLFNK